CSAERLQIRVDGQLDEQLRSPMAQRNVRNSTFAGGRLALGDRHIVEVVGSDAKLVAVDCKSAPERRWLGIDSPHWQLGGRKPQPFVSQWGAPYGGQQLQLPPGETIQIDLPATFISLAYVDRPDGGRAVVEINDRVVLEQPTNRAFSTTSGEEVWSENRRGIGPLPYGMHSVRIRAVDGPVAVLGLFSYDTRANRTQERVLRGSAYPGETITFSTPFQTRPLVQVVGGLSHKVADTTARQITFGGSGPGTYEIVGE
ncbi:MAG: hypothetical protein JNM18_17400, partial [Planctomycetaceae bacterium]|nr:hypothetical protein [Planctomycetaceae bacterium]